MGAHAVRASGDEQSGMPNRRCGMKPGSTLDFSGGAGLSCRSICPRVDSGPRHGTVFVSRGPGSHQGVPRLTDSRTLFQTQLEPVVRRRNRSTGYALDEADSSPIKSPIKPAAWGACRAYPRECLRPGCRLVKRRAVFVAVSATHPIGGSVPRLSRGPWELPWISLAKIVSRGATLDVPTSVGTCIDDPAPSASRLSNR